MTLTGKKTIGSHTTSIGETQKSEITTHTLLLLLIHFTHLVYQEHVAWVLDEAVGDDAVGPRIVVCGVGGVDGFVEHRVLPHRDLHRSHVELRRVVIHVVYAHVHLCE